jgi:outer membrane protein OmpA-like peptidoglycan-associated protein
MPALEYQRIVLLRPQARGLASSLHRDGEHASRLGPGPTTTVINSLQRLAGNAAVQWLLEGETRSQRALTAAAPSFLPIQTCGTRPCPGRCTDDDPITSSERLRPNASDNKGEGVSSHTGQRGIGRDEIVQRAMRTPILPSLLDIPFRWERRSGPAQTVRAQDALPVDTAPVVMRLTETQFRSQLGSTPEQGAAIDALFANATFRALWDYIAACPATPRQDLGPLRLRVTPGLRSGGAVRFGGYNPLTRTLEINPTKPEHQSNPTEMVDTIVHEIIHAVDDLQGACRAAGSPAAPLAGAATATITDRSAVAGTPDEARLMIEQGPSASNPCDEFIDINTSAQQMIVNILMDNRAISGVGRPTLTFVNAILRRDPAAMAAYEACRGTACALPAGPSRDSALGACSADIIGRFIPPDLTPALLPNRIQFDFGANALRPDGAETLDLIALFLKAHPAVRVTLTGHTDPVGSTSANLVLGQKRAQEVQRRLLAKGVPAAQITSVTSAGKSGRLSTGTATHWKDRRVEVGT